MWTGHVCETPAAMFVVIDLLKEGANIHVYYPRISREDMWSEMSDTCDVSRDTKTRLDPTTKNHK